MEKIDWDKAPEGATHAGFTGDDLQFYRIPSKLGGDYDFFSITRKVWCESTGSPLAIDLVQRPSPAWSGEGRPPAGVVCEAKCMARGSERDWFRAKVLYSSRVTVVLDDGDDGEFVAHPVTMQFRTIRTPEQIAADKRESAIDQLTLLIDSDRGRQWRLIAEAIYDAGYRKP